MAGFAEFWPLYLRAHRRRATRAAHYAGILLGTTLTVLALAFTELWLLLAGIGAAFAATVSSHWLFEGRRPLLFGSPLLAAAADLRMFLLAVTGRLAAEFARHGVAAEWTWRGAVGRSAVGRAASAAAGLLLAVAAAVLAVEALAWLRDGAWQPVSLDAVLRHWGLALTEVEAAETAWVDRLDEIILALPLTLALAAAATCGLALACWIRFAAPPDEA